MAYTVAEARARAAKRYPDIEDGSTFGLTLCQEALDELLFHVPLIKSTETLSSLVAGTATYAQTATTIRIWEAFYIRSATQGDYRILTVTSPEAMRLDFPGWHLQRNGEPRRIMRDANAATPPVAVYRLWPTPDTASSGSPAYPQVYMTITKGVTLGASDTLPNQLKSLDALVALMLKRFSYLYAPDDYAKNVDAANLAILDLATTVQGQSPEVQPEARPFWTQQSRPA